MSHIWKMPAGAGDVTCEHCELVIPAQKFEADVARGIAEAERIVRHEQLQPSGVYDMDKVAAHLDVLKKTEAGLLCAKRG